MIKFLRFLCVGGWSALVQFAVLALCLEELNINYAISAGIAYFISVCCHYFSNRYFTFRLSGRPKFKEVSRYLTMIAINFVVTLWVTTFTVEKLQLGAYIGTVLSIMVTVGISFTVARHWVFVNIKEYYE